MSDNLTGFAALKKYFSLMLVKINEFPSFSHDLKSIEDRYLSDKVQPKGLLSYTPKVTSQSEVKKSSEHHFRASHIYTVLSIFLSLPTSSLPAVRRTSDCPIGKSHTQILFGDQRIFFS